MKKTLPILAAILLTTASHAEILRVTFGAVADLAATYDGVEVTSTTTQGGTIGAPVITINGLDLDGVGVNDDQIDIEFAVSATGGTLSRLSVGYVLNAGYALTFDIASATVTLGPGATEPVTINALGFVSTSGNVFDGTYDVASTDPGFTTMTGQTATTALPELSNFTMTSTYADNNRAKLIIAEFDVGGDPVIIDPTPPESSDDTYEIEENTLFTNAAPGILANDTDANGDPMTAILITSPTNGTLLSFSANGSFIYQPDPEFTGTDTFTYQATDGGLTGNVATVTLTVVGTPIQLPHYFQSNMVLQRNKAIPVWGWGPIGKTVSVSLSSGQTTNTVVDANGRWEVALAAMAATNGPLTLVASTPGSSVTLTNIAVGDVWFCSGQSNAGWSLGATDGGSEEAATANYPNFRLIRVPRYKLAAPSDDPIVLENTLDWDTDTGALKDKAGTWFVCNPENAGYFGAAFYYATKEVHLELGIPIGVIQSAYAGTPMEAWANSPLPEAHPVGSDPADPQHLYNGMVYPYLRLPITGACWYQGERNHDDGGHIVAEKLPIMIQDWRTGFGQGDFPFYYIQIPPVFTWNSEAEADPMLPYFWEAQTMVQDISTNTYMVVISDTTNGDLHPRNKRPAGERMGRRILKNTYGYSSIQDQGPVFTHAVKEGNQLRLYFDQVGGGLAINTNIGYNANGDLVIDINETILGEDYDNDGVIEGYGEDLNQNGILDPGEDIDGDGIWDKSEWDINFPYLRWFEVCDAQGNFTNATAVISGNTVLVSAPTIPDPAGFRYGWSRFAQGNLMNVDGLPARMCRQTPPFAKNDTYSTFGNRALYVAPEGVLGNDQDASTLLPIQRPIVVTNTAHGALTIRSDGAFIYTPNAGFSGADSFSYFVTDGTETSETAQVELSVLAPGAELGSMTREIWNDVSGYSVDDLLADPDYPDTPDRSETIDSFDSPHGDFEGGGQRIHGYLHPPASGNYTFWITSAARSRLFLSTDDDPANASLICECAVSLGGEYENWTNNINQKSAPITLVEGQRYYIMALHNEGAEDHCSVAWNLGGTTNIIDGAYLSPILPEVPDIGNYAGWSDWFGVSGDGHVLDFAFNLDPTLNEDRPVMVPTTGTAGLPCWEMDASNGLVVEYLRRTDAPGTTYAVQFTDSLLSNWVNSSASESISPLNDEWERVMVEDETDMADATNRFGRVIVIQN